MALIGIFGTGGFGREVLPLLRDHGRCSFPAHDLVFVDDFATDEHVNGVRVLNWDAFCAAKAQSRELALAIANSAVRAELADRCTERGIGFVQIFARNAILLDRVELGEGAIICPFVTIGSNVRIGRHFHANHYSYVAHDCVIGDFVTFAPRVTCNGNVSIGDHTYIGAGAVLRQGAAGKPLVIGRGAVVGMGAVVTKDVPPGTTVVGNPAKSLGLKP